MPCADRCKWNTTGTSAATLNDGAAVMQCRNLAAAIAATDNPLALSVANVAFSVTDGTNWEEAYYTIGGTASAPTLTRTAIIASSVANNAAATFAATATLTVYNFIPATEFNRASVDTDVTFSTSVPLVRPGTAWMAQQQVSTALAFNPLAGAVKGAYCNSRLVADGANAPTWPGFKQAIGSAAYDNRAGIVNSITHWYDGYDYWYFVMQDANAVATATSLTMSLSSSTAAVNSPVTVTVSTNQPLSGSQTESVTLTAPVAGTWSANPVTLNASTATATPTFTPTATGSGNITASASGTPTLTGASSAFTATAAATSPGTPSAPTATGGNSSASVAYTDPSSNGGSAITSHTITAYKASDNSVVGSMNATSSPLTFTGLTNGTAYYFKDAASNNVGTGAQSAASNTVTPAVPAIRLSPRSSDLSESSSAPWVYTGTGVMYDTANKIGGIATRALQSGVDGSLSQTFTGYVAGTTGAEIMLGLQSGSTVVEFTALPYAFYTDGANSKYTPFSSGNRQTATNTVVPQNGDIMRLRRSGSSLIAEVARSSAPTSFTTIFTWTGVSTGVLRFQGVVGTSSGTIANLVDTGLA